VPDYQRQADLRVNLDRYQRTGCDWLSIRQCMAKKIATKSSSGQLVELFMRLRNQPANAKSTEIFYRNHVRFRIENASLCSCAFLNTAPVGQIASISPESFFSPPFPLSQLKEIFRHEKKQTIYSCAAAHIEQRHCHCDRHHGDADTKLGDLHRWRDHDPMQHHLNDRYDISRWHTQ
jgi:hypothetical protein